MDAASTPAQLLEWADAAMAGADDLPSGLWQHTAALLARQALEEALGGMWRAAAPGLESRPARLQLLCLPTYVDDPELAGRASHVWWNLTNASHHHPYELAPTAVELRGWLSTVADVIAGLEHVAAHGLRGVHSPCQG